MRVYSVLAMTIVSVFSFCGGQMLDDPIHTQNCLNELKWTSERLEFVLRNGVSRDAGCWFTCIFQQEGKMENGKMSETIHQRVWQYQSMMFQIEQHCMIEANKMEDSCDIGYRFVQCMQLNYQELAKQMQQS